MAFIRGRRFLEGAVYFTFPFTNTVFIGGRRLKKEIRYKGGKALQWSGFRTLS